MHRVIALGTTVPADTVQQHQLGLAVGQHVGDHVLRLLVIDRHTDHAGPHDAHIGGEIGHRVLGDQRDSIPTLEPTLEQAAGDRVRQIAQFPVAVLARIARSQIDDRDFIQIPALGD